VVPWAARIDFTVIARAGRIVEELIDEDGRLKEGGGVLLSVHCDTSEEITRAKDILKRTGANDIASAGEETVGATSNTRNDRTF
jgi:hypothetical protein